jgi:hypothetical protein
VITLTVAGPGLPEPGGVIPPALEAAVTEALLFLEREVKTRTPIGVTEVARGSIAADLPVERVALGDVIGRLGSPIAHVRVVNDGRRPGQPMPPPQALELWVRRKLRHTDATGDVRPLSVQESKRLAFVIARSIGEKGTAPVRMFEEAVEQNVSTLQRIFDKAGVQITMKLGR